MQTDQPDRSHVRYPIRIGLVGCGRVAEFGYLPALRHATGVKLVGVADIHPSRCHDIAPGVPAYGSMRALINAGGLDALVISTPTRFHLGDARCTAEARLPALVEKPPGVDVQEAQALHALQPAPWIAFNRRFEPALVRLKDGLPRDASLHLRLDLHYRRNSWQSFDMQDDALLDLGPHLIDLARWLTNCEVVQARAHAVDEHHAAFELELERGHATIACSNNSPYRERVGVRDSVGRVKVAYQRGGILAGIAARLRPHQENPLVTSLRGQLEAFGRAVAGIGGESSLATTADGLAVMSTIESLRYSALHGGASTSVDSVPQAD